MEKLHFCQQCQEKQPTFEYQGDGKLVVRCQACGHPVDQPVEIDAPEMPEGSGPLILHIDDEPTQRRLVGNILVRGGYTAITAADGQSGLDLARRRRPAAVLLDVMMPDIDGYEVCRRLRSIPGLERLAIIMLTGTDDPKLDSTSFMAGADLALRKPYKEQKLLSTVRTALLLKGVRKVP